MNLKSFSVSLLFLTVSFSMAQLKREKMYRLLTNEMNHEIAPSLTADGRTIVYFSQDFSNQWYSVTSTKRGSNWAKPEDVVILDKWNKSKLNLMGSHCVTPDGKTIYFSTKKYPSVGGFDIYKVSKVGSGWGTPENIAKPVCSELADVYPFVTADGQTLVFIRSVNADHNTGACGKIYMSDLKGSTWQAPVEIPVGNACVTRAVLAADKETLFFTQKINGSQNLFVSRLNNGKWSTPVEFSDFNTTSDDFMFALTADASVIYYSRKEGETFDLYTAEIPKELRPKQVYWETGKMKNVAGSMQDGIIYVHDVNTGELIQRERVSAGNYDFMIFEGHKYKYFFLPKAQGLMFASADRDMSNDPKYSKRRKMRTLQPIQDNWVKIDQSNLTKEYQLDFEYYNKVLAQNTDYKMEIVASGPQPKPIYDTIKVHDRYEFTEQADTVEIFMDSVVVTIPPRVDYTPRVKSLVTKLGVSSTYIVATKPEVLTEIEDELPKLEMYYRFVKK